MAEAHIATQFQHPVTPDFSYYDSGTGGEEYNGFGEYNAAIGAYHLGDDYMVGQVPVEAIANGYAVESGWNDRFGYYVVLRHDMPDGSEIYSLYAHLLEEPTVGEIEKDSGVEIKVGIGDTLGIAGDTPDGAQHLHLEISDYNLFTLEGSGINYANGYDGAYSPAFAGPTPVAWSPDPDNDPILAPGIGIYDPSDFIDANDTTGKVMQNFGPSGPTLAPDGVQIPDARPSDGRTNLNDPSFENGSLSDWQTVGAVSVETEFDIDGTYNTGDDPAIASDGQNFAVLSTSGTATVSEIEALLGLSDGSIEARTGVDLTVGSAMGGEIDLTGRHDSFYFDYYFDSGDYDPYNDVAIFVIDGEIVPLSNVLEAGDFGDTGWFNTGITGLDSGTHTVGFAVLDSRDEVFDSALYVDDFAFS